MRKVAKWRRHNAKSFEKSLLSKLGASCSQDALVESFGSGIIKGNCTGNVLKYAAARFQFQTLVVENASCSTPILALAPARAELDWQAPTHESSSEKSMSNLQEVA